MTEPAVSFFANPPTQPEEVTPLELQVTLGGSSSEAATTSAKPTGLHLDSSFINKTSLKAISSLGTLVYPVFTGSLKGVSNYEERSPSTKKKGHQWLRFGVNSLLLPLLKPLLVGNQMIPLNWVMV